MLRTFYRLEPERQEFDHFNDVFATHRRTFTVDKVALIQFILFKHPLYQRTFLEDVTFRFTRHDGTEYRPQYDESRDGYDPRNEERLWELLNDILRRYCSDPQRRYGIGNSGGLDSRFIIYIASTHKVDAYLFTAGDAPSDALHIANLLARKVGYTNHHYSIEADYLKRYAKELVTKRPMFPFEGCWWISARDRLPAFDLVLTGFNGGVVRGSHLTPALRSAKTRDDLYRYIYGSYIFRAVSETDLAPLLVDRSLLHDAFDDFVAHIRHSHHTRPENIVDEFDFVCRQLVYIKRSPGFDYLNRFSWKSPYYDEALMAFASQLTYEERIGARLFTSTARRFMKELRRLRFERSPFSLNDQSPTVRRVKNYLWQKDTRHNLHMYFRGTHKAFNRQCVNADNYEFIKREFATPNECFSGVFDYPLLMANLDQLISEKYVLILNLLAIKIWMDTYRDSLR